MTMCLLRVLPDVPAASGGVLLHVEVVERHAEVPENGVPELLELAQRLVLHLVHLVVVLDLQPATESTREAKKGQQTRAIIPATNL